MSPTPLFRVSVDVPAGPEEVARARMLELCPAGFEEAASAGGTELAAYVDGARAQAIRLVFPDATATAVADGWETAWRRFHRPVVAGGIWIGPPWEQPPAGAPAVVIDPGRAFGTGAHPTTWLCVDLLAELPRGSLLDVGCGSGVVAIAAARLGFGPLTAVDVDAVAVEVTAENARLNDVALDAFVLDALADPLPAADVAVANVLLDPVQTILSRITADHAVTSGYLRGERPAHAGWRHVRTAELDGWVADLFGR